MYNLKWEADSTRILCEPQNPPIKVSERDKNLLVCGGFLGPRIESFKNTEAPLAAIYIELPFACLFDKTI